MTIIIHKYIHIVYVCAGIRVQLLRAPVKGPKYQHCAPLEEQN